MWLRQVALLVAGLASSWSLFGDVQQQTIIAFRNVNILDVSAGAVVLAQTVLIEDGKISTVGSADSVDIPDEAQIVDGQGQGIISVGVKGDSGDLGGGIREGRRTRTGSGPQVRQSPAGQAVVGR